jgi:hypothetical protein
MTIPSFGTETGRIEENIFIHIELCICAKTIFFQRNCYFNFRQKIRDAITPPCRYLYYIGGSDGFTTNKLFFN